MNVSGGTTGYNYAWQDGIAAQDRNNLDGGTYQLTITDANGCISTENVNIHEPAPLQSTTNVVHNPCNGDQLGSIDLSVSGGTSGYTYAWDNAFTSQDINNLPAGSYTVTITDANNCVHQDNVIITEPNQVITTVTQIGNSCFGLSEGSASVAVSGGVGNYNYNWINLNVPTTSNSVSNLPAGTYYIDVTDGNGCLVNETVVISEPTDINLTANISDAICNGENSGQIITSLFGGIAPYSFTWSDGDTNLVRNTVNAGTYEVFVVDNNGCEDSLTVQVNEPVAIGLVTTTIDNDCHGDQQGSIDLSVSDGVAPYTYHWQTGANTEDVNGLSAGIYHVTVTDANYCQQSLTDTIFEPADIQTTISTTEVLCNGGATGTVTVSSIGGTGNLTYVWNDGTTSSNRTNMIAGTYTVTITDDNLCSKVEQVIITEPLPLAGTHTIQTPSCNGLSDGSIQFSPSGGFGNYQYSWSNTASSAMINSINAGYYTVTVTDDNGCIYTETITVTEPDELVISPQVVHPLCDGDLNGSITNNISGGTTPYSYTWNSSVQTVNMSNLGVGTYTFTVTDVNGCIDTANYTLQTANPMAVNLTTQDEICISQSGTVSTVMVGGTAPFDYTWSNGDTTANISGLSSSNYTVTITDALGCQVVNSASLYSVNPLTVTSVVNHVSCHGQSSGSINLNPINGTAPFAYAWNDGTTFQNRAGLLAGNYAVTITDINGCEYFVDTTITQPTALQLNFTDIIHSCTPNSGVLTALAGGGTQPVTYQWDNTTQTSASIQNVAAGTYTVTATDANGCTISNNIPIEIYGQSFADFDFSISQSNDLEVQFIDKSNSGQIISWYFGDGNTAFTSNPVHTYSTYGSYTVSMVVSNPCGNDTLTMILGLFPTNISNIIENCRMNVYPNPSTGLFNIELDCTSLDMEYSIEIYNVVGQQVKSYNQLTSQRNTQQVDLTSMSDGIYFISLKNKYGQVLQSRQIIIQK